MEIWAPLASGWGKRKKVSRCVLGVFVCVRCICVYVCVSVCVCMSFLLQVQLKSRSSLTNGKVHVFVGSVFPHVNPQLGFIVASQGQAGQWLVVM